MEAAFSACRLSFTFFFYVVLRVGVVLLCEDGAEEVLLKWECCPFFVSVAL